MKIEPESREYWEKMGLVATREEERQEAQGRIAALVALCEELLENYEDAESVVVHEQGHETDAALAALGAEVAEYRARLAALKGAG